MRKLVLAALIFIGVQNFAQNIDKDAYIKKESIGGKLDFSKKIEQQYRDTPLIRFGETDYSKKEYAILLWGANVRTSGIESFEYASKIWEEINRRSLTDPEKKALKTGFEAKF